MKFRVKSTLKYSVQRMTPTKAVRIALLVISDALILNIASFLALWVRFEFHFEQLVRETEYLNNILRFAPYYTAFGLIVFALFKLYTSLWQFASIDEFLKIILACFIVDAGGYAGMHLMHLGIPRSHPVLNGIFLVIMITGVRFSYRFMRQYRRANNSCRRTMIIGAGQAATVALREFRASAHSENKVVCLIDDDKSKWGQYLLGVKVVGGRGDILGAVKKYDIDEIIMAMPSASIRMRSEILDICKDTPCRLKTLPGIFQLANGEVSINKIRNVEIEDLLGREQVRVDLTDICGYVGGRVVLVTGGGGSIGSELCRQLAAHNPKMLIIFDIYENNAYDIQQELRAAHPELELIVLIGSVRDKQRVRDIFSKYRPELVFHAAAHKHVPLMETSPNEAVKNNVFGTLNVALAADEFGARRMLLISTDKAVRPTNVMGASKRICEMIVQNINNHSKTEYVAVRFGNVLGSNGSVIPLFKKQIEKGGPVTVTHRDIIRYFMTIPEAVALVLQAGAYAKGGEIFVLDMGKPVRIDDLARNMIRLSGFEPERDIQIVYTGLRPGEKLYEELLLDEEGIKKTDKALIYIAKPIVFDEEAFAEGMKRLREACNAENTGNAADIRVIVKSIVPEYHENKMH